MSKPFSQELYTENDDAKNLIIEYLKSKGYQAFVNPDKYGIDLMYYEVTDSSDPDTQYCEVEVKHNWKGPVFPFETVHFPVRKSKFAKPNAMFAMLNHERTHVLFISGQQFIDAPRIKKDTIYTRNEEFIEIKISDCKIEKLQEKE